MQQVCLKWGRRARQAQHSNREHAGGGRGPARFTLAGRWGGTPAQAASARAHL